MTEEFQNASEQNQTTQDSSHQNEAWDRMQHLLESGEPLQVTVTEAVKGGLVTDVGVRGFIPASLVDRQYVEDLSTFVGQTFEVRVVEVDKDNNRLIMSRKSVLDDSAREKERDIITSLKPGSVVDGTVQRLTNFGAFVDVGGVDGLVHISEMARHHVNHPSEVVQEGQTVRVKVLKVDPDAGKISLSMKETAPDPWLEYSHEIHDGDVVTGIVRRLVDFGAFVELRPGLEGLVHISQIANHRVEHPADELAEGQEVQVKVLGVDLDRKRISLSIREAEYGAPSRGRQSGGGGGGRNRRERVEYEPDDAGSGVTLGDLFGDLFKK